MKLDVPFTIERYREAGVNFFLIPGKSFTLPKDLNQNK